MSKSDEVISVHDLHKSFNLPHERHSGLKQALINMFRGRGEFETQHVIEGINFSVGKGDFLGIVGKNGSGKSTLLKLLAKIYTPNKGVIHINGQLTPFIELGVGFNPELTARENIYLNCALLGMDHKETDAIYDEIVNFSELQRFMDQKLKNFSSGMQVRLAFAIAVKSTSDILLFDEVLAVGDSRFQKKCYEYFYKIKKDPNRTVILVTHDMAAVQNFCTKAIVLDKGKIAYSGDPGEAAILYQQLNFPPSASSTTNGEFSVRLVEERVVYRTGDTIEVVISWAARNTIKNVGMALMNSDGAYVFGTNTIIDKFSIKHDKHSVRYKVKIDIGSGSYVLRAGLFGETDADVKFFDERGVSIEVVGKDTFGGIVKLDHEWE
ncbi:ABC transporter ATP-binding protein [Candidatus Saccharibacteria bacterium]|nr:ABC transporter ATP-binding protein [Candidatus Saccharibacteria bacterium]